MNRLPLVLGVLLWTGAGGVFAADSEAQLRTDFQKAYQAADEKSRARVYSDLVGAKEKATLDMLTRIMGMEKLPENRLAAFKALVSFEDHDGSVSVSVGSAFTQERDESTRAQMASLMSDQKFKFMPLQAMITYYSTTQWSTTPTTDMTPAQIANVEKHQANMEKVNEAINKLSGNSMVFDKNARSSYKKWWEANQATFAKADQDLVKEMKAAAKPAK